MARLKKSNTNNKIKNAKCGVQSRYNADFHDNWAWSLAIKGATTAEIAEAFGVSSRTIERWAIQHPTFKEHLYSAKEKANGTVEKSLYERANGYYVTETKTVTGLIDKNGMPLPPRVETTKKYIAGDVGAMIFWLKNRDRDNWRDKPVADTVKIESESELVKIYLPQLDETKSDNVCQQQQQSEQQSDSLN